MDDDDILRPNGTCYSINYKKAADNFIPCGNAGLLNTHFACCNYGDKCLSSNACYHSKSGITYIAGCTDPSYSHPACPQKLYYQDQEWLGLVRCGKSDDATKKEEEWAGCKEPADQSLDETAANCHCGGKQPLFRDGPTLGDVAILPEDLDGTISYFAGHVPSMPSTAPPSPTTSEAASSSTTDSTPTAPSSTGVSTTASASSIPTSTAAPETTELSVGAKAGIGAGAAAGALLIGCIVLLALLLRKRKNKQQQQRQHGHDAQPGLPTAERSTPARLELLHSSPADSGFRSELAADEPPKSARSYATSSPGGGGSAQASSPRYQAYDPRVHGDYNSQRHSLASNASSTPDWSAPVSPQQPTHGQQQPLLPIIAELQG